MGEVETPELADAALPVVVAPVPIDLATGGRWRSALRMAHISALGARHFAPAAGRRIVRRQAHGARAARLMFERLGATWVKFGQFAASAPGIVGEQTADEFRSCLDRGPAVPFDLVRRAVEAELGRPLAAAFASFGETPLAAASISVVHRARLHDGREVAVKVLRPGIERTIATDLGILEGLSRFLAARGADQAYNMVGLVVSLRGQVAEELDLRNEARTMATFRDLFARFGLGLLHVPAVHEALSGRRVLTMDYLDGLPIDEPRLAGREAELKLVVRELLRAWVLTALRAGAFHGDIHAGNLLLMPDGRLGMLDWGIVARLNEETHRLFRNLVRASLGEKAVWDDIAAHMLEVNGPAFAALGLTDPQVRHFVQEIFEPVLTKPLNEVSMAELFMTGDDVVHKATGEAPPRRSLRERMRVMRDAGRAYQGAASAGAFESPTMRMSFLSTKQLVYLERYGRMHIPDESLLGEPEFLRRVLDGSQ